MSLIHREPHEKLTRGERLCCLRVTTSVEAIGLVSGPAVCRRQSRVWSKLAGTEEEAAVWTGWTAFSSRAFQNLPGASLKQREEEGEEEEGLPVGMLEAKHDPVRSATF